MGKEKSKETEGSGIDQAEQDLEAALTAGFDDDPKYNLPEEEPSLSDEDLALGLKDKDLTPAVEDKDPPPEIDEWEGISDSIRSKFEGLQTELTKATNVANSASGRANKLQSMIDKKQDEPETPKLTSDMILEAMANKDKRVALSEEFPEFANVFDEMDKTISTAVGKTMDTRFNSFREEMAISQRSLEDRGATQRSLDIAHPGWENTINNDGFKDFVYKDGPSSQERSDYEYLLNQSNLSGSPKEKAELDAKASGYYDSLLGLYPKWAEEKGNLYGDPSGKAAIELLSLYKTSTDTSEQIKENVVKQSKSKQRLEANIAPTSGRSRQAPVVESEDTNAAFLSGFKNG